MPPVTTNHTTSQLQQQHRCLWKNLPVKNGIRPSLGIPDSLGLHTHLVLGSLITTTLWWETCHGSDSIISHVLPASVLYVPNVLQSGAMPLMMLLAKEEVEPPPLHLVEILYYIWSRPSRSCCCWRHNTPPLVPMPGRISIIIATCLIIQFIQSLHNPHDQHYQNITSRA